MPHLSKQKENKLLDITDSYMKGEKTLYQVAKECKVEWHTAKRWMAFNSKRITTKEKEIVANIANSAPAEDKSTIWARIQKAILKYIITEA